MGRNPLNEMVVSKNSVDLHFRDTDGVINFAGPDMARMFCEVAHGWPFHAGQDRLEIIADVRQSSRDWVIELFVPNSSRKTHDPINGICDLIVELNWSRLRQNSDLMCLHAAGILMGQGLLALPSARRAGKSTLTAELARRGHTVFTDDILAVRLDASGVAEGLGTGVSPRLRLPLPSTASDGFRQWVAADSGPANQQYKYLTEAPVSDFGSAAPLGAIVTLDRVEEETPPAFTKMTVEEVLPVLIHQNFGRFANSARILAALGAVARDLPCFKLTYSSFERAADFLETVVQDGLLAKTAASETTVGHMPDLERTIPDFDPSNIYVQRPGFHSIETDDGAYIADAHGVGIFRMGPGMIPIWHILQDPVSLTDIVDIMREVYPDVDPKTLTQDASDALRQLNDSCLVQTPKSCG